MATYQSSMVAEGVMARANAGETCVSASYTFTATPALNDVVQMVKIPAGAKILDIVLTSTDIDTNGSPTVVLDVGDGSDTDRFIDGSTIGRTGGVERLNAHAGHLYEYTADDTIDVLIQAGPATGAVGTFKLAVTYQMGSL